MSLLIDGITLEIMHRIEPKHKIFQDKSTCCQSDFEETCDRSMIDRTAVPRWPGSERMAQVVSISLMARMTSRTFPRPRF